MTVLETLLRDLPLGWCVTDIYVGANWVLSLVNDANETLHAGVASTPPQIAPKSRFQIGHHKLVGDARDVGRLLCSKDAVSAAVGLATLNALNQPHESLLSNADAADWLSSQAANRSIAIFGRFPFIEDEIRPHARQVWVFEQTPQADELSIAKMSEILPQADIAAITSSTIINHTLDSILSHTKPEATIVLLGPSTPLCDKLFGCGIDALFGVQVANLQQVIDSVMAGEGFQKIQGLRRVSMFKNLLTEIRLQSK
jgi:uncharacterized protein (DUF4213/DUF364 family)